MLEMLDLERRELIFNVFFLLKVRAKIRVAVRNLIGRCRVTQSRSK